MKKRHYIVINLIFLGLMAFSAIVVIQFMTGYKPLEAIAKIWQPKEAIRVETESCTSQEPLPKLSTVSDASVKKLAVYQQACRSFVTDTLMIFMSMPKDDLEAKQYAAEDAKTLRSFADVKVRPLIIFEPADKNGTLLDFKLFANGTYNTALDVYFAQLKAEGLNDSTLGIINPFPEANLPYWNNNHPEYFSPAVNNFLSTARRHFPQVQTSVLLNSATYEVTDFNWENGDYNSLLPYVKDITPGLVTYAGIQGFPWAARQGGTATIFNASEFLAPDLLKEMADKLQTKKVWFNTGTFGSKYTLDEEQLRTISHVQRKEILMTIQEQAKMTKEAGYDVAVNIFAEDKSETAEETDWSYWQGDDPFNSHHTPILTSFIKEVRAKDIAFWLFDK